MFFACAGWMFAALHRHGHLHVFSDGVHRGARRLQHQLHLHPACVVVGRRESKKHKYSTFSQPALHDLFAAAVTT